jgi:hypothetical protein
MRPVIMGSLLACAAALSTTATGQTPPGAPAIARTVVASTKLPTVVDTPLHFKAVSVTLPSRASSRVLSTNGIVYQLSGSTEVSIGLSLFVDALAPIVGVSRLGFTHARETCRIVRIAPATVSGHSWI